MGRRCFSFKSVILGVVFLAGLVFVASVPAEEKKIVVNVTTIGSRTDGSWSQNFYETYQLIKEKFPEVDVKFSDHIPFAEQRATLEIQAQMGADIIYVDSSFWEAIQQASRTAPKTWFVTQNVMQEQLDTVGDNVTSYGTKPEQGGFLAGVAAGLVTKSNILGYVGGVDYPDVLVMYTGDWVDVQKGYEAATALIEAGADVILHYSDNAGKGVFKAVKDHGIYAVGEARDQIDLLPDLLITSFLSHHPQLAEKALLDYKAGRLKKTVYEFGIEEGWSVIAPIRNVSPAVEAKVNEVREAIKRGEIKVPVIVDPNALRRLK
jgi:basic membrane protein A